MGEYSLERQQELMKNYAEVKARIEAASADYSEVRTATSALVQLTVVTKFFPASDALALYDAGVRTVGENRDQEAFAKSAVLRDYAPADDPMLWSFIGQLQTNKAKRVVQYAASVQSVDRLSLVSALGKAYALQKSRYESGEAEAPFALSRGGLSCLVQVSLADDAATAGHAAEGLRGGTSLDDVLAIAERLEETEGLRCDGVMAVAPLGADPDVAFEKLYGISQHLQESFPSAKEISAGMSGDMDAAIRWGSTQVRVGSQIMGRRPAQ